MATSSYTSASSATPCESCGRATGGSAFARCWRCHYGVETMAEATEYVRVRDRVSPVPAWTGWHREPGLAWEAVVGAEDESTCWRELHAVTDRRGGPAELQVLPGHDRPRGHVLPRLIEAEPVGAIREGKP